MKPAGRHRVIGNGQASTTSNRPHERAADCSWGRYGCATAVDKGGKCSSNVAAQKKQLPRADAAGIANAKISRRKSLKKQRQVQKVSGDGQHPNDER
jgi:hypothetical protein